MAVKDDGGVVDKQVLMPAWYELHMPIIRELDKEMKLHVDFLRDEKNEDFSNGFKARMATALADFFAYGELLGQLEIAKSMINSSFVDWGHAYLAWAKEYYEPSKYNKKHWWDMRAQYIPQKVLDFYTKNPRGGMVYL